MRTLFLLTILLGSACAFMNYPFEYTYNYEGRIAMGIPEIRSQMSGAGIKAKLIVQAIDFNTVMAKLEDIHVGETIDDTGCHGYPSGLQIKYRPIQGQGKLLEHPFEIHFGNQENQEGNVMVVSKNDVEWITDIRKSIASAFHLNLLEKRANLQRTEWSNMDAQEITGMEDTFFGRCEVSYTVLPNVRIYNEMKNVTEVIRSVNFDRCHNRVLLTHSSNGNLSMAGYGQFASIQSRSSTTRYYLENVRGSTYDIKKVIVQGNVLTNPFGYNTEKLTSITNQTFVMVDKKELNEKFVVPMPIRNLRTWEMEVYSPYTPSATPVPWINFHSQNVQDSKYTPYMSEEVVTGIKLTEKQQIEFYNELSDYIKSAAKELIKLPNMPGQHHEPNPWKYDVGRVTYYLDSATRIARALPVDRFDQLFRKYHNNNNDELGRMQEILLVDIMSASGSGPAIKALLDIMRRREITDTRASTVFMTLTQNLISTSVLHDIMNFTMELDLQSTPYLTSTAWINFASTLNRLCFNPYSWKYAVPHQIFGASACRTQELMDEILPFFIQKLQEYKEEGQDWKKIVVVQALNNLGTPQTLRTLSDVVRGEYGYSMKLRSMAVYALTHYKMTKSARQQIFNILMPIIINPNEAIELRQVSVFVALTWHPDPSFWHRLSILTWSEHDHHMASFVYFVAQGYANARDPSLARQSKMAKFTLPSMRPFLPSFRYSYEGFFSHFITEDQMATDQDILFFNKFESILPKEMFYFLYNNFGGVKTPVFEMIYFGNENVPSVKRIFESIYAIKPEQRHQMIRDRYHRRAQDVLSIIKDQLNANFGDYQQLDMTVFLSFFKNMQLYLPINHQLINKVMGQDGERLLKKLAEGQTYEFTKFFNPVQMETFIPSEIGLPILTRVSSPSINFGDSRMKLFVSGNSKPTLRDLIRADHVTFKVDNNYKYITKTLTSQRALLPWNMKLIATGVDSLKNVNVPASYNLTYTHNNEIHNFTVAIVPRVMQEFPVVHMHNLPYVLIKRFWPGGDPKDIDIQTIKTFDKRYPVDVKIPIERHLTGVEGYMTWLGDAPFPFTRGYTLDVLMNPEKIVKTLASPTAKMWAMTAAVNFGRSDTNAFYPSLAFITPISSGVTPFSKDENRVIDGVSISKMNNIVGRLLLNGTQTRYFETIISYLRKTQNKKHEYIVGVDLRRSAIPRYDSNTKGYCLDWTHFLPELNTYEEFVNHLRNGDMEIVASALLKGGQHCRSKEMFKFYGKVRVSDDYQKQLINNLRRKCFDDPLGQLDNPVIFNKAEFNLDYTEANLPVEFKNFTYNVYDVFRGMAFPHSNFNYMYVRNPKERITFRASRLVPNHRWYMNTSLPTQNLYFQNLYIPYAFEDMMSFGEFHQSSSNLGLSKLIASSPSKQGQCTISPKEESLHTFDGTYVSLEVTPCYTILSMDKVQPEHMVVKARKSPYTQESEVMIVSPEHGMNIEMSFSQVEVNGVKFEPRQYPQVIKTSSGRYFGELQKFNMMYVALTIPGSVTVIITRDEKIVIEPEYRLRGSLTGLCGNFNGVPDDDFKTPHGQRVPEYLVNRLQYAWTLEEGQQCRREEVREKRQQLYDEINQREKSHEERVTEEEQFITSIDFSGHEECNVFVHPIVAYHESGKGKMVCLSKQSLPRCHPLCHERDEQTFDEDYICFEAQKAPRELLRGLKKGFTQSSINVHSHIERRFPTRHVNTCQRL